ELSAASRRRRARTRPRLLLPGAGGDRGRGRRGRPRVGPDVLDGDRLARGRLGAAGGARLTAAYEGADLLPKYPMASSAIPPKKQITPMIRPTRPAKTINTTPTTTRGRLR